MGKIIRYLSHPQVLIDPQTDVQKWSLSDVGRRRVEALGISDALSGTAVIISSAETKAIETASFLAEALGCEFQIRKLMHENDRRSTDFLPFEEFETVADQFFAHPNLSVRGWETAAAAQTRIVAEIKVCLSTETVGDILFVGHGAVGTLLFCYLSGLPISRKYDQGPGGGGCYFEFIDLSQKPLFGWQPMEHLIAHSQNTVV